MAEYVCLGLGALDYHGAPCEVARDNMMRDSIYLIELLNFLNRPLFGYWPTDYEKNGLDK